MMLVIAAVGIAALKMLVCVGQPRRELPAVAGALDAEPIAIDPRIAAQRGADAVEDILTLVAVLVREHGVGERLAVAGRAAVVDHQRRPAARGIDLILKVERRPLLAVRAAVDVDDQRMLPTVGRHVERPGEERLDLELVVVGDERERLDFGDRPVAQHRCVEVGHLAVPVTNSSA